MKDADSKRRKHKGSFISRKPSGIALNIQVFQCMLHHNHHNHHQHHNYHHNPSGTRQNTPTSHNWGNAISEFNQIQDLYSSQPMVPSSPMSSSTTVPGRPEPRTLDAMFEPWSEPLVHIPLCLILPISAWGYQTGRHSGSIVIRLSPRPRHLKALKLYLAGFSGFFSGRGCQSASFWWCCMDLGIYMDSMWLFLMMRRHG